MNKLNKEQQLKVENSREAIRKLQEAELIIYNNLAEEVGLDDDWLYDYVFNCTQEDDYTNMVKKEIFQ